MMQPRFEKRSGNTPFSLAEQPRFRAGFDFLRLRADVGEIDEELADWWQAFSLADDGERESLVRELRAEQQRGKKQQPPRTHRVPKQAPAQEGQAPAAIESEASGEGDEASPTPAKKRRRRRRKPSGGGGAEGQGGGVEPSGDA